MSKTVLRSGIVFYFGCQKQSEVGLYSISEAECQKQWEVGLCSFSGVKNSFKKRDCVFFWLSKTDIEKWDIKKRFCKVGLFFILDVKKSFEKQDCALF